MQDLVTNGIEWKEVVGYPDYFVSTEGVIYKKTKRYGGEGFELKQSTGHHGYRRASLSNNGYRKTVPVHRIVAMAFIPNPANKPQVNHINGITSDNRLCNLEWVTSYENLFERHGGERRMERLRKKFKEIPQDLRIERVSKSVRQFDLQGNRIADFPSIKIAAESTGIFFGDIGNCCRKASLIAGGYQWAFSKNLPMDYIHATYKNPHALEVICFDTAGNYLKTYNSLTDASTASNTGIGCIIASCKSNSYLAGGFLWRYAATYDGIPPVYENPHVCKVWQYTLQGAFIAEYPSIVHAESATGVGTRSICDCCGGGLKRAGNYMWRYAKGEVLKQIPPYTNSHSRPVLQYDLAGTFIAEFTSASEGAAFIGVYKDSVGDCCRHKTKSSGGYVWVYKDEKLKSG